MFALHEPADPTAEDRRYLARPPLSPLTRFSTLISASGTTGTRPTSCVAVSEAVQAGSTAATGSSTLRYRMPLRTSRVQQQRGTGAKRWGRSNSICSTRSLRCRFRTLAQTRRILLIVTIRGGIGLVVAVVASLCVATASASGGKTVVDWASAPAAPSGQFGHFRVTLAQSPRYVGTFRFAHHSHRLIVGPLASGDFCSALTGAYGGSSCPTPSVPRSARMVRSVGFAGDQSGPIVVMASFQSSRVARIVLTFEDAKTIPVPFVWVTTPINAGFAYVGVPTAHRRMGHRPLRLLFFGSHNELLRRADIAQ